MKKTAFFMAAALVLALLTPAFSQDRPVATETLKSQEDLQRQEQLEEELWKGEKVFIEDIAVSGVKLVDIAKINKLALPYKKRWLSKNDIDALIRKITSVYKKSGLAAKMEGISYNIEGSLLKISVKEITP